MLDAQNLARRVRALADRRDVSPSTLSRKLFGNGKRLEEIEAGGSLTLTTYARAQALLAQMEREAA
jgi:sulfate adenylyltransferase subunit 2